MKQTLVLLIILTLFSFMAAIACPYVAQIVCIQNNIRTCKCVRKDLVGVYAISHSCNFPQIPYCEGISIVRCGCK